MKNTGLKHDEEEILGFLNIKKEQVMAYIRLSKMEHEAAETKTCLNY